MAESFEMDTSSESESHGASDGQDKKESAAMEIVLRKLGDMGRYQLTQITLVLFQGVLFAFVMLNFVFIGYKPEHKCQKINETDLLERHGLLHDNTTNVEYDSCAIVVTSNSTGEKKQVLSLGCYGGYTYDGGKTLSMVTEWDLVCDKRGLVEFVQSMSTLGLGVGIVLSTSLADRYGRKYVYMITTASTIATELGLVFAPNIYTAIALRFLTGFTAGGMSLIHCIIEAELVITKYRQIFWAVDCAIWSVHIMALSGIAYLCRHTSWRYLQLATPLLGIPAFLASFAVNETPMWYFAKGRFDDARRILRKACQTNGKNTEEVLGVFQKCIKQANLESTNSSEKTTAVRHGSYTLIDIVRNKPTLVIVLISGFTWFTYSLAYYGLYLTSSTLAGDRFINFFLMSLLEIPSSLICIVMLVYFGRRTVVLIFTALSALSLLVSTCMVAITSGSVHVANTSTAFFLLGKFAVASSFNVAWVYTPELLVTTIRSAGSGVCAMFARVGGILAPFLLPLFQIVNWAPGAILTFLCFVCLFIIPILPESKGKELPTTMEEMQWGEKPKKPKVENNQIESHELKLNEERS